MFKYWTRSSMLTFKKKSCVKMVDTIKIECNDALESMKLILHSIRTNYPELDFIYYLFDQKIIPKKTYKSILNNQNKFYDEYIIFKKKYIIERDTFNKLHDYQKRKYAAASKSINIGRVGESLTKSIFRTKTNKSITIFKKLISNMFEPGIDFICIKYNRILKNFEFFFFEVKATQENYKSCENKINSWYSLGNFTKKYILELESIKEIVSKTNRLSDREKSKIKQDLLLLAKNLVENTLPSIQFHFCSSVYCGIFKSATINIERDSLINNGKNYIFILKDFYKNIKEAYKCLEISI